MRTAARPTSAVRGARFRAAVLPTTASAALLVTLLAGAALFAMRGRNTPQAAPLADAFVRIERSASGQPPPAATTASAPTAAPGAAAAPRSEATATPVPGSAGGTVVHVAPGGDDAAPGSEQAPLRTIRRALALAGPGDTVQLRAGVYQEAIETVRAGTPDRSITITSEPGARAIIDGRGATLDAPRLVHSYVTLRGLEIRDTREGVRVEGAEGAVLANNEIHHVDNECVRLRFSTRQARVERNVVHHCGLRGNGEGIYVGVAPEQRAKNGGQADLSTGNTIAHNEVYSVQEGIDVKEDASGTTVVANFVHDATDPNSGGINVRGDDNYIAANRSFRNAGAGFRVGGDIATHPLLGPGHAYGTHNTLVDNVAEGNAKYGYKFMRGPQLADCSNRGADNGGRLYYFDGPVTPFFACP
jgi:hypothetical protein